MSNKDGAMIIGNFVQLQRSVTGLEVGAATGNKELMLTAMRMIEESYNNLKLYILNSIEKGKTNDKKEESHNEANQGREQGPSEQSVSTPESSRGEHDGKQEREGGK